MEAPPNPIVASWNWISYQCSKHAASSVAISTASGIGSGYLLSRGDTTAWFYVPAAITAIVATMPLSARAYWEKKKNADEDLTAARERVMDEAIPPLLEEACQLSTSRPLDRQRLLKTSAKTVTQDLITAYARVQGVRAVVYKISDDGKRMIAFAHSGRNQKPQPFDLGTPRGDRAFAVLSMADNFQFVSDVDNAPISWEGSGKGYKTYISAPIRVGDSGYGMLTLDAPKVGDLDSRDGSTVSLMAAALSIYFSEAARSSRNLS